MYNQLIHTGNAQKLPIPQDAWMMYRTDNHEIVRLDLKPGEAIEKHANDWRIVFFVLEGTGTLTVEDQSFELDAHQLMAIQPGLLREWKNGGDQNLKLLAIKTQDPVHNP